MAGVGIGVRGGNGDENGIGGRNLDGDLNGDGNGDGAGTRTGVDATERMQE